MSENKQNTKTQDSSASSVGFSDLLATKNLRWFIKHGGAACFIYGFTSKKDAARWVQQQPDLHWSAGSVFKLKSDNRLKEIVNRKGEAIKF